MKRRGFLAGALALIPGVAAARRQPLEAPKPRAPAADSAMKLPFSPEYALVEVYGEHGELLAPGARVPVVHWAAGGEVSASHFVADENGVPAVVRATFHGESGWIETVVNEKVAVLAGQEIHVGPWGWGLPTPETIQRFECIERLNRQEGP